MPLDAFSMHFLFCEMSGCTYRFNVVTDSLVIAPRLYASCRKAVAEAMKFHFLNAKHSQQTKVICPIRSWFERFLSIGQKIIIFIHYLLQRFKNSQQAAADRNGS